MKTDTVVETLASIRKETGRVPTEEFWNLVNRYRADLVNQAYVILGNQEDAEDAAQESLSQAYLDLEHLQDPAKLGAWLRRINHNRAIDIQRRRIREREERLATGQMNALAAPHTTTAPSNAVKPVDGILRCVDSLPEQFRQIVVLRYWERLSIDAIADRLGIPAGTVCSRLARANRRLAQKIKP